MFCMFTDLSLLSNMTYMICMFTDLSVLSNMPYLVELDASHNEICNMNSFKSPLNLKVCVVI